MKGKKKKTIVFINIGVFSLLLWWLLTRTQTTAGPTQKENFESGPTPQRQTTGNRLQGRHTRTQNTLTQFQSSAFYLTIVNNNLFRPLGWRPPRPREPYRLTGKIISINDNKSTQAILQSTTARTIYIVRIGDTFDKDTTVTGIQPKQVTLENTGHQRTLKLNTTLWIK